MPLSGQAKPVNSVQVYDMDGISSLAVIHKEGLFEPTNVLSQTQHMDIFNRLTLPRQGHSGMGLDTLGVWRCSLGGGKKWVVAAGDGRVLFCGNFSEDHHCIPSLV
jgi:hypothetical protein